MGVGEVTRQPFENEKHTPARIELEDLISSLVDVLVSGKATDEEIEKAVGVLRSVPQDISMQYLAEALENRTSKGYIREVYLGIGANEYTVGSLVNVIANGSSSNAKKVAEEMLFDLGDSNGYPLCRELVDCLGDGNDNVRVAARKLLERWGCGMVTVECLYNALDSNVRAKRELAQKILIGYGPVAKRFLPETDINSPKYGALVDVILGINNSSG